MCRAGEPPAVLLRGQLCDGLTVRDVALTGRRPDGLGVRRVASWNARWMVNPRHHRAKAKRARIT
eukprot:15457916-Alexandrium_andersonii.AAC.1